MKPMKMRIERKIQEEEAKERLAELLDDVERGESIAIIRDGKKFAAIIPVEDDLWMEDPELRRQAMEKLLEARKGWGKTKKVSLEEILEWRYARE